MKFNAFISFNFSLWWLPWQCLIVLMEKSSIQMNYCLTVICLTLWYTLLVNKWKVYITRSCFDYVTAVFVHSDVVWLCHCSVCTFWYCFDSVTAVFALSDTVLTLSLQCVYFQMLFWLCHSIVCTFWCYFDYVTALFVLPNVILTMSQNCLYFLMLFWLYLLDLSTCHPIKGQI